MKKLLSLPRAFSPWVAWFQLSAELKLKTSTMQPTGYAALISWLSKDDNTEQLKAAASFTHELRYANLAGGQNFINEIYPVLNHQKILILDTYYLILT
jgi:hypothetical protein